MFLTSENLGYRYSLSGIFTYTYIYIYILIYYLTDHMKQLCVDCIRNFPFRILSCEAFQLYIINMTIQVEGFSTCILYPFIYFFCAQLLFSMELQKC